MTDDVQRAVEQRRGLWVLHDEAGRLDRRISDATTTAPAGIPSSTVPEDGPEDLLSQAQRALQDALEAEREVAAQQQRISQAEAAITAIEDEQARRRQQLIVAVVAVAAVVLLLIAVWLSG